MYTDEYGVQFSDDRKTILACPEDFKGEYVIPADVTFIDDGAFAGILGITRVTFVNSDVMIGEDAFSGCDNIEAIIVPKGTKDLFIKKFEEAYIEQNVTDCINFPKCSNDLII